MPTNLPGSKFGEGVGGAVGVTDDPNDPSYDPATHKSGTDQKIRVLLGEPYLATLSPWEINFLGEMYGKERGTRKQHITVSKIYKRVVQEK